MTHMVMFALSAPSATSSVASDFRLIVAGWPGFRVSVSVCQMAWVVFETLMVTIPAVNEVMEKMFASLPFEFQRTETDDGQIELRARFDPPAQEKKDPAEQEDQGAG